MTIATKVQDLTQHSLLATFVERLRGNRYGGLVMVSLVEVVRWEDDQLVWPLHHLEQRSDPRCTRKA
eukprot:CAMPEP_0115337522 /NCGR_PEP_ID=MMETSP0270-20121206/89578_1 /TAXON_ID=71861 /ORGANISM="Scrippsiella trochoidea, Strain CCMP3099" /LENGTH=66 /DNA_ID=CAMNT_0002758755 /DNA_START=155 /DNA_END=352 /DNA_ORIENTATION=+